MPVHIDFETYSECDLKKCGAWAYACHPSTKVLCMAYAIDDKHPTIWLPGQPLPDWVKNIQQLHLQCNVKIHAFNSFFEYCIWHNTLKWQPTSIEYWENTQAHAMALALPRSLEGCCEALDIPMDLAKDKRGKYLIQRLSKPYRGKRIQDPALLAEFYDYCKQDVIAERHLYHALPWHLSDKERQLWALDQAMNISGLPIDVTNIHHAVAIYAEEKARLLHALKTITQLDNPNSRDQFFAWLNEQGVAVNDLQASTLQGLNNLTEDIQRAIYYRQQLAKTPIAKYQSILKRTSHDNRLRGFQLYHGASTGRFSSTGVNFQNLPRPVIDNVDACIDDFKHQDPEVIRRGYRCNVMDALSSCIRGMIKAPEGKVLLVADYHAIEARVLAWLAGDRGLLQDFVFKRDIYRLAAAEIYKKQHEEITDKERTVGKVSCIAEDELVLTNVGLIPIQNVTSAHKVWDGLNWVNCDGAVYKGEKEVITYDGLTATKDHIVFTKEGREVPFGKCASKQISLAKTGFGRQAVRLGEDSISRSDMETTTKKMGVSALFKSLLYRLRHNKINLYGQPLKRQDERLSKLFTTSQRSKMARQEINSGKTTLSKPQRQKLEKLWWPWNKISFSFGFRRLFMGSREFGFASAYGIRSHQQRCALYGGKFKVCKQKSELSQHSHQKAYSRHDQFQGKIPRNKICRQYFKEFIRSWVIFSSNKKEIPPKIMQTKRHVWDILNAGSNNRFTVSDTLVHNCLALGYQGGVKAFQSMAVKYGLTIDTKNAQNIVDNWRTY